MIQKIDSTHTIEVYMQPILIKIENLYNSPRKVSQLETFFQLPSVTLEFLPSFSKRNYFSPFNLVFIHQLSSWEVFQQKENVFIARDGLLDLVSFFIKSPHPPLQNKSIIMFPKEFSAFIPDAWKEISLAYGYRSTRKTYLEKSLNLIGVGHLDLDAIDKDKTKVFLNKIKIEKSKYHKNKI